MKSALKPRPFQQRMWMLALMSWIGMLSWIPGVYLLATGKASLWWLSASVCAYFFIMLVVSVGCHRLFTHQSFKCGRFWHYLFAVGSTISWHGSPIQWAVLHNTHHRHSDTERDPHFTGWSYFLWKKYNNVNLDLWNARKLLRDPMQCFVHDYYSLIGVGIILSLFLISPELGLFGYLMPAGLAGVIGSVHQVFSHRALDGSKSAQDFPLLEFVFPMVGEWIHKKHHEEPWAWDYRTKWWHFDLGAMLIKAIRT